MILNPGVLHCDSFAKYAVAFFNISRSISALLSCFRRRLFSACSSETVASSPHGIGAGGELLVPVSQALLAHTYRLCGCFELVLLFSHQANRITLEIIGETTALGRRGCGYWGLYPGQPHAKSLS